MDTAVAKAWNSTNEAQHLTEKMAELFKNMPNTRYWVIINYYKPDNGYSLFFNIKKQRAYQRSIPIARYENMTFDDLIDVLKEVRNSYQFTFEYHNFTKEQQIQLYNKVN